MQQSHATYLGTRTFGSLDGLRAMAILAVLWHHAAGHGGWVLLGRGFLGVDLFFEISGFLIVTLLLRERRASGTLSLANFYARRCLRILPAYWVLLAVVALTLWLKPGATSPGLLHDLPLSLLYVSNLFPMASLLGITWSLSAEEQFYLVVPALEKVLPRTFAVVILPVLYLCVILPPFGLFPGWHLPAFFRETTFGPILLGVMLAHVLDQPRGWAFLSRWLNGTMPLIALAVLLLACCYPGTDISGWPRLLIQLCMLLMLASCVVREDHALKAVLTWPPVRRIGVVSYGIYLYHMLVFWPVGLLLGRMGIQPDRVFLFAVVTLATWAVAEVSYRFLERPFLESRRRYLLVPRPQTVPA